MYEFNVSVSGSFEEVVAKTKAALMENQLGVVSEVDVPQDSLISPPTLCWAFE